MRTKILLLTAFLGACNDLGALVNGFDVCVKDSDCKVPGETCKDVGGLDKSYCMPDAPPPGSDMTPILDMSMGPPPCADQTWGEKFGETMYGCSGPFSQTGGAFAMCNVQSKVWHICLKNQADGPGVAKCDKIDSKDPGFYMAYAGIVYDMVPPKKATPWNNFLPSMDIRAISGCGYQTPGYSSPAYAGFNNSTQCAFGGDPLSFSKIGCPVMGTQEDFNYVTNASFLNGVLCCK